MKYIEVSGKPSLSARSLRNNSAHDPIPPLTIASHWDRGAPPTVLRGLLLLKVSNMGCTPCASADFCNDLGGEGMQTRPSSKKNM